MGQVIGSVTYRERMLLPRGAEVVVTVEDVSRMDVAAEVLGHSRFPAVGGPPFDFVVEYDQGVVRERMTYALRARIEVEGRLLFTTTAHIPAFTHDPGEPITLTRVGAPTRPDAPLANTRWTLRAIDGVAVTPGSGRADIHLLLEQDSDRVRGFSGCNTFAGSYAVQGTTEVRFGPLAGTRRACPEGMEQEHQILMLLGTVTAFAVTGDTLALTTDHGQRLDFEAVYLT